MNPRDVRIKRLLRLGQIHNKCMDSVTERADTLFARACLGKTIGHQAAP